MTLSRLNKTLLPVVAACALLGMHAPAKAQGFAALVSPPRFEASARAGTTYRDVVEINNVSGESAHFSVATADWTLKPDGSVDFSDGLAPNSCRPWVGLEAADITLAPAGKRRYRFEVAVPADAPTGECRFAIMISGDPQAAKGSVAVPVAGRIGVIVYLATGDAMPKLEIVERGVKKVEGRVLPVVRVRNNGNAHGRVTGLIDGTDATGRHAIFEPANLPILPGETRDVALTPRADDDQSAPPKLTYPVHLKGRLESGKERMDIDESFVDIDSTFAK
ncbi:hypothetical protein MNR01_11430 [Lysobacter sp. S4-A87]|uniref:COG1470 family protein n=1 Tax=Lysobacter sp. S4-A87 TaxID=2925843 RepID=UPI001F539C89|nr:hypothetical protein [Lysobacter sp. S4-A87]UNK48379.1 hypothetical protein MNR01_11430 [Lysobacter sp. S4-A87]